MILRWEWPEKWERGYTAWQLALGLTCFVSPLRFNKAVIDALSKVRKPGMVLKDEQLMAIHVYNGKDMLVLATDGYSKSIAMTL